MKTFFMSGEYERRAASKHIQPFLSSCRQDQPAKCIQQVQLLVEFNSYSQLEAHSLGNGKVLSTNFKSTKDIGLWSSPCPFYDN